MARVAGQFAGWICALALACCAPLALAQAPSIQFPSSAAGLPGTGTANVITQPGAGAAINPYTGVAAPFDPYSASGSAAYQFWGNTPPSNSAGVFAQPPAPAIPSATNPYLGPGYVPPAGQPQSLFPNGMWDGSQFDYNRALKFVQDLRLRATWVGPGDDPQDLGITDIETAVTFTIPNFLTTSQPLFISPAFALHLWDGPALPTSDLPANAYSAYIDTQWSSDPLLQVGAELGFRIGVYTDFEILNSHSLRLQGLALGTARLTPNLVAKLGVVYIDRNDIKLLPAGGLLWTPTPQIRFDIFFPQPKLAGYLMTVGRYEVWGYVAGEYGGGAWTIQRAAGDDDRIDINDIRISGGLEWTGPKGVTGFFEAGYVFKRAVIYVENPADDFNPDDSFMIRAGFSF